MYGDNYGYRSGLNRSMVDHLTQKISELERTAALQPGDTVLDIGSNDATGPIADLRRLLEALAAVGKKLVGYGASTKGNVLLQFCEIGPTLVSCIAEVNEDPRL